MSVETYTSPLADEQVRNLRGKGRKAYDAFLIRLRAEGCKALQYRLTGEGLVERLCCVHLEREMRVVVAFESDSVAEVVLVAPHDENDPERNVYNLLYELAGPDAPPTRKRIKPPCCGDSGLPPTVDVGLLDDLERRARELARPARQRRH